MKAYKAPELQIFAVEAIDVLLASSGAGVEEQGEADAGQGKVTEFAAGGIDIFR